MLPSAVRLYTSDRAGADLNRAWVELVGDIIMARIRGQPTEETIRDCQARVITLIEDTNHKKLLYDALELDSPTVEITLVQQNLSEQIHAMGARVAIVVPNSRIAYLSRLAFGAGAYRVFYNDMAGALNWLQNPE